MNGEGDEAVIHVEIIDEANTSELSKPPLNGAGAETIAQAVLAIAEKSPPEPGLPLKGLAPVRVWQRELDFTAFQPPSSDPPLKADT